MTWGRYYETESQSDRLLFEVVDYIISGEIRVAQTGEFGFYFCSVFARGSGIGGDPGWGIMHIPSDQGLGSFILESDIEYSASELGEATFSAEEVFECFGNRLRAYAECYPRDHEIVELELARLPTYRKGLSS
jgi:hypothetical protein